VECGHWNTHHTTNPISLNDSSQNIGTTWRRRRELGIKRFGEKITADDLVERGLTVAPGKATEKVSTGEGG
jgi:hypothetical protein